ncbi:MAG TPA: hypothetical protein PKD53_10275 [Chloroflexaceae bacterium]|nr:hypothetical protein [Chloroflexaceae bacterium]
MRQAESFHRYPRLITAFVAWLSAILVTLAMVNLGVALLRGLWDVLGRDDTLLRRVPFLLQVVTWIEGAPRAPTDTVLELLPTLLAPLAWAAAALFLALVLRNAFPAVRTSSVGMLVEFAGTWLPLRWEDLRELRVTQDLAGERFVILAQTAPQQLTAWHRLYSFLYGFGQRPGFYITSNISQFDDLLKTMIGQSERTARALEGVMAVRVREEAQSPLFRLLLSPGAFFSRTAGDDTAAATVQAGGPVRAAYPPRITALVGGATALLALALAASYLLSWARFLALSLPALRPVWPFSLVAADARYVELFNAYRTVGVPFMGVQGRPDLPAPWWLLVAAHLMLLVAVPCLLWLRGLLPALESREDGLAVRDGGRWRLVPWERVRAFKATELSEQSQILLLQSPQLPAHGRLSSMLYDGSGTPGALITSAISNFQPLLGHAVNSIVPLEQEGRPPVLQQEARSWLFWLALQRRPALAALVAEARADEATKRLGGRTLTAAAAPMALLSLPPALMLLAAGLLGDTPPSLGILGAALGIWLFGMLEWPLVSLLSVLLDESTGGGEEGYRAAAVYPASQLPRLIPLAAALLLTLVGLPVLPALAWAAAIAWAYWLAAGLFEALYEWKGSQAILGGLLPVVWQLLMLIGFLIATR